MTIFRHSNYAVPGSRTDSFSPIITSALAPALGQKGAQNMHHPIAQLKTLFNLRFKLMRHPISQNIISCRFFVGTLAVIFGAVSFSVPSPAFAVAPNQNPVKIFSDDFETGDFSKWTGCRDKISTSQVHSGSHALHYDGWPGCAKFFQPSREVYFKHWWYIPSGFTWNPTGVGGRHFWRMGYGTSNQFQIEQLDTGPAQRRNNIELVFHLSGGATVFNPPMFIPEGRWFKSELYVQLNDPGVANGLVKLWIDGEQRLNQTNVNLKAGNDWNILQITTNYDSCSGICDWYVDDVEVWNGCPSGASCNGGSSPVNPSPVNLAPPSNLRVVPAP